MKNSVYGTPPRLSAVALLVAALVVAGCGEKKTELGEGGSVVSRFCRPCRRARCRQIPYPMRRAGGHAGAGREPERLYRLQRLPPAGVSCAADSTDSPAKRLFSGGRPALPGCVPPSESKNSRRPGCCGRKSTVAKGQGYEAQYTLVPSLTFSEQDAGRSIAGVIAMIPVLRDIAGLIGLAEQVKLKEAQTALLLTDNETTEQVAAATGSARTTDLGAAGALFGRLGGGAGAGWSNTNEGKVIAAAFLDSHNKLVAQVRMLQAKELPPPVATQGRP